MKDADGNIVTDNYSVTTVTGSLTITQSDSEWKISLVGSQALYDADAHHITNVVVNDPANGGAKTGTTTYKYSFDESMADYTDDLTSLEKVDAGSYTVYVEASNPNYAKVAKAQAVLKINPRKVTLTSGSAKRTYDGTALTLNQVTVTGDGFAPARGTVGDDDYRLAEGLASYSCTGSQLVVGKTNNEFTYQLADNTKAGNYVITKVNGELEITAVSTQIIVTAGSAERMYNGEALTSSEFTYSEGILIEGDVLHTVGKTQVAESGLVVGERLKATVEGTITEVGSEFNRVTAVQIFNAENVEVTSNYRIFTENGTLTITAAQENIRLTINNKIYDGMEIGDPVVEKQGNGSVTIRYYDQDKRELAGKPKTVGQYYVVATVTGSTNHEESSTGYVAFEITRRDIIIVSGDARKVYDGTPLTCSDYEVRGTEIAESGLVEGQEVQVVITGSLTEAGSSENIVGSVTITENAEVQTAEIMDVTENYNIVIVHGTLVVEKAAGILEITQESKVYDAARIQNPIVVLVQGGEVSYTYYDAQQNELTQIPTEAGEYYVRGTVAESANYNAQMTPYVPFTIYTREMVITASSAEKQYDGEALISTDYTVSGTETNPSGLVEGQSVVAVMEGRQTQIGSSENRVGEVHVYAADGREVTDNYSITRVAGTLTVREARIELTMNDFHYGEHETPEIRYEKDPSDTIVITYYDENGELLAQEPLYVGSYYVCATIVKANGETKGDTGLVPYRILRRPIIVTSYSETKVYDGTPLENAGFMVAGNGESYSGILAEDTAVVSVIGQQINVGTSENGITDIHIYKNTENGQEEVIENYDITVVHGTLEVTRRGITVQAGNAYKQYDGTPLTCDRYDISGTSAVESGLIAGHRASVLVVGSQTEVGTGFNIIANVQIFDAFDVDVTNNYEIYKVSGWLTVLSRDGSEPGEPPVSADPENPANPVQPVKTGDENMMWLWILMILSGGYITEELCRAIGKKKNKKS